VDGAARYWAFERECINRALLDIITATLQQATAAGKQIYVRPNPQTLSPARDNLRAFCAETVTRPQPKDFIPISTDTQVTDCLGWTEFKGSEINSVFQRARVEQDSKVDDETYPAIVYQFVAEDGIPKTDAIISQLDFFHLTGFMTVSFNETNWLGQGVLVDFSDIVPYHTGYMWWRPTYYAQQEAGFCRRSVERAAQTGLLGPPPKFIQEPRRRIPAYYYRRGGPTRQNIRPPPPPSPREPLPDDEDNPPQSIPFMNSRFAPAEQAGRMEEPG
jgi:hypothetical protein